MGPITSGDTKVKPDWIIDLRIDKDGFILEPEKWNETIAKYIARIDNIETMTKDHWKVVLYIRDFYLRFGVAPPLKLICKHTRMDLKRINALFPSGIAEGACKIAGLPLEAWCWRRIK